MCDVKLIDFYPTFWFLSDGWKLEFLTSWPNLVGSDLFMALKIKISYLARLNWGHNGQFQNVDRNFQQDVGVFEGCRLSLIEAAVIDEVNSV